jgi:CHAT domain-containing protein
MRPMMLPASVATIAVAALLLGAGLDAQAQSGAFVAPPRTISDITAIIDQEKPDPSRAAKLRADADANPPAGAGSQFYVNRCQARAAIGRSREAIADCEQAAALAPDYLRDGSRYLTTVSQLYRTVGDFKKAIAVDQEMAQKLSTMPRTKGRFFGINLRIAINYMNLGEFAQAESYIRKNQALLAESKSWPNVEPFRSSWTSIVEQGNARLFEVRGRFQDAANGFRQAHVQLRDALGRSRSWPAPPPAGSMESTIDFLVAFEGRAKARLGRLAEAEADIRRALLSRLRNGGKFHPEVAQISTMLAAMLTEQARFKEAEQLARAAVDIYRTIGYPEDTQLHAFALNQLATNLFSQRRWEEAGELYARLDAITRDWDGPRRDRIVGWARIFTNYYTGRIEAGLELARAYAGRAKQLRGDKHQDYAYAQAIVAAGLVFARRDAEAMQIFKASMPVLLNATRDGDYDEATGKAAQDLRMQQLAEAYLTVLARTPDATGANTAESFRFGELVRGQSVQKALAASSARAAAQSPALAELVRKEQDLEKQIAAELGNLNNMLALPPDQRDDKHVRAVQAEVEKLRTARATARREIERKFPNYADLVAAKPSSVEDIRAALKPGEAFVSLYFGRRNATFVWAIPKQGPVAFATVQGGANAFDAKVKKLREALDPQAQSVSEIPAFDVALAHELYAQLLKPVEQGWKGAKDLIVVTNGALALLPLGVLPTEPPQAPLAGEPMFAGYRKVAWLARTHAVTMVPSAAALRTLRHLRPGSPKRELMVGFGDPYFSAQQAARAEQEPAVQLAAAAAATRGIPLQRRNVPQTSGVDSAELGLLPRLPDTADELKSIALALQSDPAKVLHLGKAANERNVKSLDLSKYKIVVFATHGLVPGELNGLHQPALAMSAPDVANHDGDGLLTMEEILALKLDADWVVLSACNTGAGAGAGAEAASGLGRAFFYAGTRAILVTNWAVHSASARELVTDLFRRQAADARLSRGEALRQAMIALLDDRGFTDDSGKVMFAYAHPLFWAPYTIIGDGGGL